MENQDTVNLLKECDAGAKMAISSLDEVLGYVQDKKLLQLLSESKKEHEQLCMEVHTILANHGSSGQEPPVMAKGMSWLKTNLKLGVDNSDSTISDLVTDGCNMGIKTLHKYLNEYTQADNTSKGLAKKLISLEETLCEKLHAYL